MVSHAGTSQRVYTVETTTTETQKGNGEVTTTSSGPVTVGSRQERLACQRISTPFPFGGSTSTSTAPESECASRNLYVA
jgi:hypothetical protein